MSKESYLAHGKDKERSAQKPRHTAYRRWVWGIAIADLFAVILLLLIGYMTSTWDVWANVIAVGLVGIASVNGVILQVLIGGQMAVTMDRQEIEMTLQRQAMSDQSEVLKKTFSRTATSDRAYFALHPTASVEVNFFPGLVVVFVTFVNGGKTPAWQFFSDGDVYTEPSGHIPAPGMYFNWKNKRRSNPSLVPPGVVKPMQIKHLRRTQDDKNRIIAGDQEIFVDGEVRYRDFDGRLHAMRYGLTVTYFGTIESVKGRERYQEHYEPEDSEETT